MNDKADYYRAKLEEAERNAATAQAEADKLQWLNIAAGYRILAGDLTAIEQMRAKARH